MNKIEVDIEVNPSEKLEQAVASELDLEDKPIKDLLEDNNGKQNKNTTDTKDST